MKKILFCLLLILAMITFSRVEAQENFYINNNNIEMTEVEYTNLLNLGFTEYEISYMDINTYNQNKNLTGELVSVETKYYKSVNDGFDAGTYEVSEEEYYNYGGITLLGTIETYYKSVTTAITRLNNSFRYKVSTNWLNFPSVKNYDVIAIGMSNQVYINSDIYFKLLYCDTSSCYESTAGSVKSTSNGGGVSFKLPNITYTALSSVLYFDVSKNTSSTINNLSMCGAYAHSNTSMATLTDAINYSLSSSGISFNAGSVGKFDLVQCSTASWSGSW